MSTISGLKTGIGKVTLTVNDLDRVSDFYQEAVGLHLLRSDAATAELGVEGKTLLELRRDPGARRRSPREAGLFHTAFLLPSRADLGRWIQHAMNTRPPVVGASDHAVSEALYLSDPEGNGVEIYADRPVCHGNGRTDWSICPATRSISMLWWRQVERENGRGFPKARRSAMCICRSAPFPLLKHSMPRFSAFPSPRATPAGPFTPPTATTIISQPISGTAGAGVRSYPSTGLANIEIIATHEFLTAVHGKATEAGTADTTQGLTLNDPWGTEISIVSSTQQDTQE
jgi:catechol 2,3-dioxygenase